MASKKPRPRTEKRAAGRERQKLVRDLDRLARLEPGGSADRPVTVDSPAQIEVEARSRPCPLCGGPLRLEEHAAETLHGARLRVARVACRTCGIRRDLYFQLASARLN